MGRLARVVTPGPPHHVTQRGNGRARVFFADEDRHGYLKLFQHYRLRYGLQIMAYCLMDNHVHWVVVPEREEALAGTFRDAHASFAAAVNRAKRQPGHLFQGRFFSCALDEEHLWAAVR
jgi:putative transposase